MASWWCAIHGYAVPELDAAARTQLESTSHVMLCGLIRVVLAEVAREHGEQVAADVSDPRAGGGLMHEPTFMGNPLVCVTANANIDLLLSGDPAGDVARIHTRLEAGLAPLRWPAGVREVRTLGAIHLERPVDMATVTRAALDAGVWLRPFRDLVYAIPP